MDPQQSALEGRLAELAVSAKYSIQSLSSLQNGKLKDAETTLERVFASMRATIRELHIHAEEEE